MHTIGPCGIAGRRRRRTIAISPEPRWTACGPGWVSPTTGRRLTKPRAGGSGSGRSRHRMVPGSPLPSLDLGLVLAAAGALHERSADDRRGESHHRDLPGARAVEGDRPDTESAEQDPANEKHEPEKHQDELADRSHGRHSNGTPSDVQV